MTIALTTEIDVKELIIQNPHESLTKKSEKITDISEVKDIRIYGLIGTRMGKIISKTMEKSIKSI